MSKLYDFYGVDASQGDYLFKEGDPADYLYMIHEGSVKITRMVKNQEEILQILKEGEFVGEMAVIDSTTRSANAIALENCQLIKMDIESYNKMIETNNQFAVSFIRFLSQRLRAANEVMKDQTIINRDQKFQLEVLYEFIKKGKKDQSGRWLILDRDDLIESLKEKHWGNEDRFWTYLDDLLSKGTIKLKKDRNNKNWIALDLDYM